MTSPCRLSMRDIVALAAAHFGVSVNDLVGPRRHADLVRARAIVAFAIRELLPRSYPEIGRALGSRDHSTIMAACSRAEAALEAGGVDADAILAFLELCRNAPPSARPDVDPFEMAGRIMRRPELAVTVSTETIRDFAAIVTAVQVENERAAETPVPAPAPSPAPSLPKSLLDAARAVAEAYRRLDRSVWGPGERAARVALENAVHRLSEHPALGHPAPEPHKRPAMPQLEKSHG